MFEKLDAALNTLRKTRVRRISVQVLLLFFASMYTSVFMRWVTESRSAYGTDDDLGGTMLFVSWVGFAILYRTLVFDRIAFCAGLIAGGLWLLFGDALAMPFWAGSMALIIYLYRSRRDFRLIFLWYLFIATVLATAAYNDQYSFVAHPLYLVLFGVLLIACLVYEYAQKVAARRKAALQTMQEEAALTKAHVAHQDDALDQQIARLEKIGPLSAPVQKTLAEIVAAARDIRRCMQTDERDKEPGRQFLQRYLPIVEKIVTKGQTLAHQLDDSEKRQQAITEQQEALASLSQAFRQQHQQLLKNDTDDLSIEIKALEKILKTDGYR